jgi:predicted PurR-regulated permease PerM
MTPRDTVERSNDESVALRSPVDIRSVALTLVAVATVILLLRYMQEVIIPFVLAGLLFYALDPIVDWLQRWRAPRVLAAALVMVVFVAVTGGAAWSLRDEATAVVAELPEAARELRAVFRQARSDDDGVLGRVERAAREIEQTAAAAVGQTPVARGVTRVEVTERPRTAADYLWWGSLGFMSVAGQLVLVLFLTFFLLVSDDLFKRRLVELAPTFTKKRITVQILEEIAAQIERFLLVQLLVSAIVGVATGLALWWFGISRPVFWGVVAGVLNTIPYFGPFAVSAALWLVGFMQFKSLTEAAWVAGVALAITSLEGWLLTPALMGRVAQMNHVAVFAGLLFWSWMWGVWGLLLAVPMMMVFKAVCDRVEEFQPIGRFLGE